MYNRIYLNVPFAQKEEAKALGARWNPRVKKWYYEGNVKNFEKFGKWILPPEAEEILIAYETLCVIDAPRICYKCKKETRIVGLGIWEHSKLFCDDDIYFIDEPDELSDEELHLAWTDDETTIPPLLLDYLKKNYNVKTGYSRTAGKCFANHCQHCDAIQGNHYLFTEDSPLSTMLHSKVELQQRIQRMNFHNIYIDQALALSWDMVYCSNDWAYTYYGHGRFEDVEFDECEDMYITYEEMYRK